MNNKEKSTREIGPVESYEGKSFLTKDDYVKRSLKNLKITSQTVERSGIQGHEDSFSSKIADKARENFRETIEYLYEERFRQFNNPEELRVFVEGVAQKINEGILSPDNLIRSYNSDRYPHTRIENLSEEMKQFYEEFFLRLQDPSQDPEELAGWVEYRIDLTDHFFTDGCGRVAKAISSWVLMRANRELPRYRSREELYQHAPTQIRGSNPEANRKEYDLWIDYYKSLFETKKSQKIEGAFEYVNGEEMLLALSPVFKRRYTHDGDLILGCRYGCEFCYYRWISASKDYIGTGRLKRIATPEQMVEFLKKSKLFLPRDILILGARGDASMYPQEVIDLLRLIKEDEYFRDNIVLALHRAPASETMKRALLEYPQFRFGTTITPKAYELGWTKIKEESQIKGLERLLEAGIDPDRISIEVGPLNSQNIEEGMALLQALERMGFKNLMVRGVAFGTFGVDREKELQKMRDLGFIDPSIVPSSGSHEYYVIKNFLTPEAYQKLQEMVPRMKIHRHTYTYYQEVWNVPIAFNRDNQVRISQSTFHSPERVKDVVEKYGLKVKNASKRDDHYFVELSGPQAATEDIAMTIGAELETAVIFDNYRRTASLDDVRFYQENSLFYLDPYIKKEK